MAGNKSLVLLDYLVSPFAQRCRIALAEKKIPCEFIEQEIFGAKSELLLRSNPVYKKVPVLLHDGRPVSESLVILDYLEDAFPDSPPLLPADPYARAQAWFWAAYSDKDLRGRDAAVEAPRRSGPRAGPRRHGGGAEDPGARARGEAVLRRRGRVRGRRGGAGSRGGTPGLAAWARRCGAEGERGRGRQPEPEEG
ncbi:hypothetical protein PR202_ga15084 [Eleusine coracana subsp. coracana]|uniref:Glutathione S-transferase n=1 Tax=Eleusine coracana subsp. coracana TaxID=191504 RepID=A0AAV5CI46_ELECO|nr:hypothetical protein PR202_ga15084 [Eleusine coracana subsp. coracana]